MVNGKPDMNNSMVNGMKKRKYGNFQAWQAFWVGSEKDILLKWKWAMACPMRSSRENPT